MPKETDQVRLRLLLRVLRDSATNVVLFKTRVFTGSDEPDDVGLEQLLPDAPRQACKVALREALASFLAAGGQPNRIEYSYADRDPETIYEFRFEFARIRAYVKTELKEEHSNDATLVIRSVKRQN